MLTRILIFGSFIVLTLYSYGLGQAPRDRVIDPAVAFGETKDFHVVCISSNGKNIFGSNLEQDRIIISKWSLDEPKTHISITTGFKARAISLTLSPSNSLLVACSMHREVCVWNYHKIIDKFRVFNDESSILFTRFIDEDNIQFFARGCIIQRNIKTKTTETKMALLATDVCHYAARMGSFTVLCCNNQLYIYQDINLKRPFLIQDLGESSPNHVGISDDGKFVYGTISYGTNAGKLFSFDVNKKEFTTWLSRRKDSVMLGILPMKKLHHFITADSDGLIDIWSDTGNLLKSIKASIHSIETIAVSDDNNSLLSSGQHQRVNLWDITLTKGK